MNTSQDVKTIGLSTLLIVGCHKTGPQAMKIKLKNQRGDMGKIGIQRSTKSIIFSHLPTVFALVLQIT